MAKLNHEVLRYTCDSIPTRQVDVTLKWRNSSAVTSSGRRREDIGKDSSRGRTVSVSILSLMKVTHAAAVFLARDWFLRVHKSLRQSLFSDQPGPCIVVQ